jgi:DNA-binding transcriptional MerR regulator
VRLLRYYEEQGLLMPSRRPSGYREYESGDIERVGRIRVLLAVAVPILKLVLDYWRAAENTQAHA